MKNRYFSFLFAIVCVFISGVLVFGRAFSILHVNLASFSVFITEIILLLCLPLFFLKRKVFSEFPKPFIIFTLSYFLFSCFYFLKGLLEKNFFVLRDITLFAYILFMPVMYVLFYSRKKLRFFFLIILAVNILAVIMGRIFIFQSYTNTLFFSKILSNMKASNFGLNYGIAAAFLLPALSFAVKKTQKILLSALLSLNLYMILICAERALWLGIVFLFCFSLFVLRAKLLRSLLYFVPVLTIVFGILFSVDSQALELKHNNMIMTKLKTVLNIPRVVNFLQSALTDAKVKSLRMVSAAAGGNIKKTAQPIAARHDDFFRQNQFLDKAAKLYEEATEAGLDHQKAVGLLEEACAQLKEISLDGLSLRKKKLTKEVIEYFLWRKRRIEAKQRLEAEAKTEILIQAQFQINAVIAKASGGEGNESKGCESNCIQQINAVEAKSQISAGADQGSLTPTYEKLVKSIKDAEEEQYWGNIYWRFSIWKQAIDFGMKAPLFGRGFGVQPNYLVWQYNYDFLNIPEKKYFNSNLTPAHNHLITIFYKMGLFGFVLFILINISIFCFGCGYIKRCRKEFAKLILIAGLGSFIFWNVVALFFDIIDSPPTSVFLWIFTGLIFAAIKYDSSAIE